MYGDKKGLWVTEDTMLEPKLERSISRVAAEESWLGFGEDLSIKTMIFRLAGILQGIIGRVRDGTAASEHAEDRADRVRPLAESGWFYAQKAGAV